MFTRNILLDQNAPAFALLVILLKRYGLEAVDWEAELMRHKIETDYHLTLTDLQHDKLQTAIVIFTTNWFETDWLVFEHCCQLMSNQASDADVIEPLEAEQIVIGVSEATLIRDSGLKYDDEIRAYVGLIFSDYGLCKAPRMFPTAIMPAQANMCDDKIKNEALQEIFDTHVQYVLDYVEDIE